MVEIVQLKNTCKITNIHELAACDRCYRVLLIFGLKAWLSVQWIFIFPLLWAGWGRDACFWLQTTSFFSFMEHGGGLLPLLERENDSEEMCWAEFP